MPEDSPQDSALTFPCLFPIKAFGEDSADFEQVVFKLVKAHVPELNEDDLSRKTSSGGRYAAVTVNIIARDQAQLDAIYQDLSDSPNVLMSL